MIRFCSACYYLAVLGSGSRRATGTAVVARVLAVRGRGIGRAMTIFGLLVVGGCPEKGGDEGETGAETSGGSGEDGGSDADDGGNTTDPTGGSGSGGDSGDDGTSAGDSGSTGGDLACEEFVGMRGEFVTITVQNTRSVPVYFDVSSTGCAVSGTLILDIHDGSGPIPWVATDVTCPSCRTQILYPDDPTVSGCYCASVECIPSPAGVLKLDPGGSWTTNWSRSTVTHRELAAHCIPENCAKKDAGETCDFHEPVPHGSYPVMLVPAGTEPNCLTPGCDCDASLRPCTIDADEVSGVTGETVTGQGAVEVPGPADLTIDVG